MKGSWTGEGPMVGQWGREEAASMGHDGTPTGRRDQGVWTREDAMVACMGRGPRNGR